MVAIDHCNIVVLVSGRGSNLQQLLDAVAAEKLPARIAAVISNRPNARALSRARNSHIATAAVDHSQYSNRDLFENDLLDCVNKYQPDLVVLAGFMRILSAAFVEPLRGRLINIHPSLLPLFPGLDTHRRVLESKSSEHGATVHFVSEQVDAGPSIVQGKTAVRSDDSAERLQRRVQEQIEYFILPLATKWFAQGRLQQQNQRALLDGKPLPEQGWQWQGENIWEI